MRQTAGHTLIMLQDTRTPIRMVIVRNMGTVQSTLRRLLFCNLMSSACQSHRLRFMILINLLPICCSRLRVRQLRLHRRTERMTLTNLPPFNGLLWRLRVPVPSRRH